MTFLENILCGTSVKIPCNALFFAEWNQEVNAFADPLQWMQLFSVIIGT